MAPLVTVTVVSRLPPPAGMVRSVGETSNAHAGTSAPACWTIKFRPATLIWPCRGVPSFDCTAKRAVPGPLAVVPPITVMKAALLDALHAHPDVVVTLIANSPPACVNGPGGSVTVNAQPAGGAGGDGVGVGVGDDGDPPHAAAIPIPQPTKTARSTRFGMSGSILVRLPDRHILRTKIR